MAVADPPDDLIEQRPRGGVASRLGHQPGNPVEQRIDLDAAFLLKPGAIGIFGVQRGAHRLDILDPGCGIPCGLGVRRRRGDQRGDGNEQRAKRLHGGCNGATIHRAQAR